MNKNIKAQEDLLLIVSSVRALWGMITPSLRSVSVELKNDVLFWQCIFDKGVSEKEIELMSEASTEVIADFNKINRLEENIKVIPYPERIENLKNLIYLRFEKNN